MLEFKSIASGSKGNSSLVMTENVKLLIDVGVTYLYLKKELNDTLELDDFINTPVRNLSLGQRIRCEIAASLIHKPEILFLDEPTIGLDPVVKENIRVIIKRMNKEFGTTIFLTSHDVGDIEKLCKRVIIINDVSLYSSLYFSKFSQTILILSTSNPLSTSSNIISDGFNSFICSTSFFFFSPPLKPTFKLLWISSLFISSS